MFRRKNRHSDSLPKISAIAFAGAATALTQITAANAEDVTPDSILQDYLMAETPSEDMFSESMLKDVSIDMIIENHKNIRERLGKFCTMSPLRGHMLQHLHRGTLEFEKGNVDAKLSLDGHGKIDELYFFNIFNTDGGLESASQFLADHYTGLSMIVLDGGETISSIEPDRVARIPDIEALHLLSSVKAGIDAGAISWDDVIAWDRAHSREESRVFADWPHGHTLTLRSLVDFAMQNEPSAQDAIRSHIQGHGVPLIEGQLEYSPAQMCDVIAAHRDEPSLSVWKGPATGLSDHDVTYKGGGNDTTFNHTVLIDAQSREICVSATWHNPDGVSPLRYYSDIRALISTAFKGGDGCLGSAS